MFTFYYVNGCFLVLKMFKTLLPFLNSAGSCNNMFFKAENFIINLLSFM